MLRCREIGDYLAQQTQAGRYLGGAHFLFAKNVFPQCFDYFHGLDAAPIFLERGWAGD
jgi:hypothetical protein